MSVPGLSHSALLAFFIEDSQSLKCFVLLLDPHGLRRALFKQQTDLNARIYINAGIDGQSTFNRFTFISGNSDSFFNLLSLNFIDLDL